MAAKAGPVTANFTQPAVSISAAISWGRSAGFISAAAAPIRAAPSMVAIERRLPTSITGTRSPGRTPAARSPRATLRAAAASSP